MAFTSIHQRFWPEIFGVYYELSAVTSALLAHLRYLTSPSMFLSFSPQKSSLFEILILGLSRDRDKKRPS